MDHNEAVREMLAEKYLLNELSPESREAFEEHLFGCNDCAQDVKAGALLISGLKTELAEVPAQLALPARKPVSEKSGWLAWTRPAFAVPAMLILAGFVGYQNLVTYPRLKMAANTVQVLPWAAVSVSSRGANAPRITIHKGEGFLLFLNIPPDSRYSSYVAELHNPAGQPEFLITIPASSEDGYPVRVPAATREPGNYILAVQGVDPSGQKTQIGQSAFELHIQQ